jgi:hypothetical protein
MTERVLVGEEVPIGTGLVELYMNFAQNPPQKESSEGEEPGP